MENKGWVKLYREILNSSIWQDITAFRIFIYLILNATHQDGTRINGVELKQGQFIRSYRQIANDLEYREGRGLKQYSVSTIKRNIDKLIKDERVSVSETEYGTLFTVLNYAKYQGLLNIDDETRNTSRNEVGTKSERSRNKNKNDKNDKNDKNNILRSKYKFETHHMKLARLLFKKMKENNPNVKEPNFESWANTFRLMMERDGREGKEIQDMILWTQSHHFWYKNILSADKLRKQYDRLILEMKDDYRFKVIDGGGNYEKREGSYESNSSQYDFSKRSGL